MGYSYNLGSHVFFLKYISDGGKVEMSAELSSDLDQALLTLLFRIIELEKTFEAIEANLLEASKSFPEHLQNTCVACLKTFSEGKPTLCPPTFLILIKPINLIYSNTSSSLGDFFSHLFFPSYSLFFFFFKESNLERENFLDPK